MPDNAPRAMWLDRPWAMLRPALTQLVREHIAGMVRAADGPAPAAAEASDAAALALGGDRPSSGGIVVIPLVGVITPWPSYSFMSGYTQGLSRFRAQLRKAVADPEIKAIVIDVDSPGGMVSLVPETADEVFAARQVKPVIAVANTLAASAAYWIAAQATTLVVTPSGDVGSVGVYQLHEDWSAYNEKLGVAPTYIHAGEFKVEANAYAPLSDEAKAHIQGEVDEIRDSFHAAIARGRGVTVEKVAKDFGSGRTLSAPRALAAGMVDDVMTFEEAISVALTKGADSGATALAAAEASAVALLEIESARAAEADALKVAADALAAESHGDGTEEPEAVPVADARADLDDEDFFL